MRPRDSYGNYFDHDETDIEWKEIEKIRAEINTNYSRYRGKSYCIHISFGLDDRAYKYYFENHGFDDINIYLRTEMEE
ncbi:MAG: hypothetical protein K6F86_08915 [Lachnospiraceae bacterium]|nr:hypothetical protein [Lachnospiraceae bacterium]